MSIACAARIIPPKAEVGKGDGDAADYLGRCGYTVKRRPDLDGYPEAETKHSARSAIRYHVRPAAEGLGPFMDRSQWTHEQCVCGGRTRWL